MSQAYNLLNQIHKALSDISGETENPRHKAILSSVNVVLNELALQTDTSFYLKHLTEGAALLEEGLELVPSGAARCVPTGELHGDGGMAAIAKGLDLLNAELVALARSVDEMATPKARDFIVRLSAWEGRFYAHGLKQALAPASEDPDRFTRGAIEAYLRARFPEAKSLRVTNYVPLLGGFSKRTILLQTEDELNGSRSLVLRAEQSVSLLRFSRVNQEFHTIQFLRKAGLPVAEPLWLEEDTSYFGVPFLVSAKAPGVNHGALLMGGKDKVSPELLQSIIDNLCALHNVRLDSGDPVVAQSPLVEWLPYGTIKEATRHYVSGYMERLIRDSAIVPTPQLVRAMNWLKANVPDLNESPVILHLDFGLNNMLIEGERVTALLDWESAILGNPADDIITTQQALAPFISMEEFLARYKAGTGRSVSEYSIAYARVAKSVLYLIIFLNARQSLLKERPASIMLSLLGYQHLGGLSSQIAGMIDAAEALRSRE